MRLDRVIDTQLEIFETNLFENLKLYLQTELDLVFWSELGELCREDSEGIKIVVDESFEHMERTYESVNAVKTLLNNFKTFVKGSVWIAMNVPFPYMVLSEHVEQVIEQVIDNVKRMYYVMFYQDLRHEVAETNYKSKVIQRRWRACYYEPHHPVCRRRLSRQFEEILSCV